MNERRVRAKIEKLGEPFKRNLEEGKKFLVLTE
jgi:hypothetical protein